MLTHLNIKYIDADLLKAEIERRKQSLRAAIYSDNAFTKEQKKEMLISSEEINRFNSIINSLQQKHQEIDLEEEINRFLKSEESTTYENAGSYKVGIKDPKKIAYHFFELGLKIRKEK